MAKIESPLQESSEDENEGFVASKSEFRGERKRKEQSNKTGMPEGQDSFSIEKEQNLDQPEIQEAGVEEVVQEASSFQEVMNLMDDTEKNVSSQDTKRAYSYLKRLDEDAFPDSFFTEMKEKGWTKETLQDALEGIIELEKEQRAKSTKKEDIKEPEVLSKEKTEEKKEKGTENEANYELGLKVIDKLQAEKGEFYLNDFITAFSDEKNIKRPLLRKIFKQFTDEGIIIKKNPTGIHTSKSDIYEVFNSKSYEIEGKQFSVGQFVNLRIDYNKEQGVYEVGNENSPLDNKWAIRKINFTGPENSSKKPEVKSINITKDISGSNDEMQIKEMLIDAGDFDKLLETNSEGSAERPNEPYEILVNESSDPEVLKVVNDLYTKNITDSYKQDLFQSADTAAAILAESGNIKRLEQLKEALTNYPINWDERIENTKKRNLEIKNEKLFKEAVDFITREQEASEDLLEEALNLQDDKVVDNLIKRLQERGIIGTEFDEQKNTYPVLIKNEKREGYLTDEAHREAINTRTDMFFGVAQQILHPENFTQEEFEDRLFNELEQHNITSTNQELHNTFSRLADEKVIELVNSTGKWRVFKRFTRPEHSSQAYYNKRDGKDPLVDYREKRLAQEAAENFKGKVQGRPDFSSQAHYEKRGSRNPLENYESGGPIFEDLNIQLGYEIFKSSKKPLTRVEFLDAFKEAGGKEKNPGGVFDYLQTNEMIKWDDEYRKKREDAKNENKNIESEKNEEQFVLNGTTIDTIIDEIKIEKEREVFEDIIHYVVSEQQANVDLIAEAFDLEETQAEDIIKELQRLDVIGTDYNEDAETYPVLISHEEQEAYFKRLKEQNKQRMRNRPDFSSQAHYEKRDGKNPLKDYVKDHKRPVEPSTEPPEIKIENKKNIDFSEFVLELNEDIIDKIIAEVEREKVVKALKGASEDATNKFFLRDNKLEEECEYFGPVRLAEIEKAQKEIIDFILENKKEIVKILNIDELINAVPDEHFQELMSYPGQKESLKEWLENEKFKKYQEKNNLGKMKDWIALWIFNHRDDFVIDEFNQYTPFSSESEEAYRNWDHGRAEEIVSQLIDNPKVTSEIPATPETKETKETPETKETKELYEIEENVRLLLNKAKLFDNADKLEAEFNRNFSEEELEHIAENYKSEKMSEKLQEQINQLVGIITSGGEVSEEFINNFQTETGLKKEDIDNLIASQQKYLKEQARININSRKSGWQKFGAFAKGVGKITGYIGTGAAITISTAGFGGFAAFGALSLGSLRILERLRSGKVREGELEKELNSLKKSISDNEEGKATAEGENEQNERMDLVNNIKGDIATRIQAMIDNLDKDPAKPANKEELPEEQFRDYILSLSLYLDENENYKEMPKEIKQSLLNQAYLLMRAEYSNNVNTEELMQSDRYDLLVNVFKKSDKLFSKIQGGDTATEQTVTTGAFVGAGMAARSVSGLRNVLGAYTGIKFGEFAAWTVRANTNDKIITSNMLAGMDTEANIDELLSKLKSQINDPQFQEYYPSEYNKLRAKVDELEQERIKKIEKKLINPEKNVEENLTKVNDVFGKLERRDLRKLKGRVGKMAFKRGVTNAARILGGVMGAFFGPEVMQALGDEAKDLYTWFKGAPEQPDIPPVNGAQSQIPETPETPEVPDTVTEPAVVETPPVVEKPLFETLKVERTWMDNDTPGPNFDQNEQQFKLGGYHRTGLTKAGDVEFDMSKMAPEGSYHETIKVDAQAEISSENIDAEGNAKKLVMLISLPGQEEAIQVPINSDGKIVIAQDSPLRQLFERGSNGQVVFKGEYMEIAQVGEETANGVTKVNVLATSTGNESVDQVEVDKLFEMKTAETMETTTETTETTTSEVAPADTSASEEGFSTDKITNDVKVELEIPANAEITEVANTNIPDGQHLVEVKYEDNSQEMTQYVLFDQDENEAPEALHKFTITDTAQIQEQVNNYHSKLESIVPEAQKANINPVEYMQTAGIEYNPESYDVNSGKLGASVEDFKTLVVENGINNAEEAKQILDIANGHNVDLQQVIDHRHVAGVVAEKFGASNSGFVKDFINNLPKSGKIDTPIDKFFASNVNYAENVTTSISSAGTANETVTFQFLDNNKNAVSVININEQGMKITPSGIGTSDMYGVENLKEALEDPKAFLNSHGVEATAISSEINVDKIAEQQLGSMVGNEEKQEIDVDKIAENLKT